MAEKKYDWAEVEGAGFENTTMDDFGIPFMHIIQKMNPEVDVDDAKYDPNLAVGDIVLSTTKEVYGDKAEAAKVIPLYYRKAWVEWVPRTQGGGYVGTHGAEIMDETTRNDKGVDVLPNGNLIRPTAYVFVKLYDEGEWVDAIIAFTSTQLKKARQWLNIMRAHKLATSKGPAIHLPMFSHGYSITTVQESNDQGTWYGWKVETGELQSDPKLIGACAEASKSMSLGAARLLGAPDAVDELAGK